MKDYQEHNLTHMEPAHGRLSWGNVKWNLVIYWNGKKLQEYGLCEKKNMLFSM